MVHNLEDEWESFLNGEEYDDEKAQSEKMSKNTENNEETNEERKTDMIVLQDREKKCNELYISTKTKITYLDKEVDLNMFWDIPVLPYTKMEEGIIKKQMKFTCETKEEYDKLNEKQKGIKCLHVNVIKHIDNPQAHIKFKYVCKVNVGICKKDILCYKTKTKGAFYNCMVLIMRIFHKNEYKEVNVKIFNTGKLSFPGMVDSTLMEKSLVTLIKIFNNCGYETGYNKNKIDTVLINSNFNCGFFLNRDVLYNILKFNYGFNVNYDPCSYPGIQCKYKEKDCDVSFMIFRTGSVLIVGKCNEEVLYKIYNKIKNILLDEYEKIYTKSQKQETNKKTKKKKLKKKVIYITNEEPYEQPQPQPQPQPIVA